MAQAKISTLLQSGKTLLVLMLSLIVVSNVLVWFTPLPFSWIVIVASLGLFALMAVKSELTLDDIGFGLPHLRPGVKYGSLAAGVIVLAMVLALMFAPQLYQDERFDQSLAQTLLSVLLYVPLRTVLWEEFMFRGLLWGLINKKRGAIAAGVISSVIFGLWHVLTATGSIDANSLTSSANSGAVVIVSTVLLTALAGFVLAELRRRSGSLLAPIIVHWAVNGMGVLLAYVAWS